MGRSMRIALVTSPWATVRDGPTGGAERVVLELRRTLCSRGHAVDVYAPWQPELPHWAIGVRTRAPVRLRPWMYALALRRRLHRYDGVVAINCPWLVLVMPGRVLLYVQNTGFRLPLLCGRKRFFGRWLWSRETVAACSSSVKHWLEREHRVPARIMTIWNGVDVDRFHPGTPPPAPPVIFGFAGQWCAKKGFPVLIEAAHQLTGRSDVQFRVAGSLDLWGAGSVDDATRAALDALPPNVHIVGAIPHSKMPDFYRILHVLLLPSTEVFEGLPLSALEALACGVPVIASDVPGLRDIVRHGVNGLLVEPGNAAALLRAIEQVADDPGLLGNLRSRARESVLPYSLEAQADAMEQALRGPALDKGLGAEMSRPRSPKSMKTGR